MRVETKESARKEEKSLSVWLAQHNDQRELMEVL
jgi:hypothetical protein